MKNVGADEARTHLSRLLREVERGENIVITRRGRAVARLVPVESDVRPMTHEEVMAAARELRRANRLDGLTIRELIDEGRRY